MQSLSSDDLNTLFEAFHFFFVEELRDLCKQYKLPHKGLKADLITSLMHYLKTGKVLLKKSYPEISIATRKKNYPLQPDTLMLHGSYKSDHSTRLFLKRLIGEHFHFTAFGLDWLKSRWIEGEPPSYQEFAKYWQEEYLSRKQTKKPSKKEWALINFVKKYSQDNPEASKQETLKAWNEERERQVSTALTLLNIQI